MPALDVDVLEPSIRAPRRARTVPCALCDQSFLAAGPTGHLGHRPVCDPCMVEHEPQLGMVLVLISVVRAYGRCGPCPVAVDAVPEEEAAEATRALTYTELLAHISRDEELAKEELLAFARLYERAASRWSRARKPLLDWPADG